MVKLLHFVEDVKYHLNLSLPEGEIEMIFVSIFNSIRHRVQYRTVV